MKEPGEGQMSFPIKIRRIEKPRRPVTRRVRFTPATENPPAVIPKPGDNSEQNSLTNGEGQEKAKKFQYGQGEPDELGRTNKDAEYGIPKEFYGNDDLRKLRDKLKKIAGKSQGPPDELGRTDKFDPEYKIPAAFYSEEEAKAIKDKQ